MKYALESIDNLVIYTLNPANFQTIHLNEKDAQKLYSFAKAEQDQICGKLKTEFFSIQDEKQLELYVQRYQATIIHLADIVVHYISECDDTIVLSLYNSILQILESLLSFIENYFSKYFDLDAKIPQSYKIISHQEFQSGIAIFKKQARKFSITECLQLLILDSYSEYEIANTAKPITFRKLIYHKKLLSELLKIINHKKNEIKEEDIITTLQYFNFNHVRFLTFITTRIALEVNEQPSSPNRIEHLYWHLKFFNQLQMKPQFSLYPHLPTLPELCCSWLQEEIFFHEKKSQPALVLPHAHMKEIKPIETSLSVPQMAFLIKILVDSGYLKIRVTAIFRMLLHKILKQAMQIKYPQKEFA